MTPDRVKMRSTSDLVPDASESNSEGCRLQGRAWWLAFGLVLSLALAATLPTTGDLGLTWDEPAYRFSQVRSARWWEQLGAARNWQDVSRLLDADALLFYWPYARHGINFHPPLAGQLSLLTHAAFGRWVKDVPSRRMASSVELALTIAIGFGFLARRYGVWQGVVLAGSLLAMPRVYGDAHIAATDAPGLLLWAATALAFWKGLNEPDARGWRVMVGVLLGLGFVEKMGAVFVLGPLLLWLVVARLAPAFLKSSAADWADGLITSAAMLAPLALALAEILRLTHKLPEPRYTDLFVDRPLSSIPGAILAVPLAVWIVRRLLGRLFRTSPIWGVERPALESWTAIIAFAPVVGWLGNPAWWRETLPRLAHYYMLNTNRRGSLPDIRNFYLGETYLFSLPWHNAWVLIAVTVPASILLASNLGLIYAFRVVRRDRLPLYFVLHLVTLPIVRMFPTPAHDGVRLFLPTFFFLAGLAAWGTVWMADDLARWTRSKSPGLIPGILAALVLGPAAWQLVKTHPYELSYYNELIGGPRGACRSGLFERTYWYDAFNPRVIADLNRKLPRGAVLGYLNPNTEPGTFHELQTLGELRPDLILGGSGQGQFPYVWLLAQDSKATSFTRLLHAMRPWYVSEPRQLDGLRVAAVADPVAVSRAWVLSVLAESESDRARPRRQAPGWVHRYAPFLGRLWGEGLVQPRLGVVNEPLFAWARTEPDVLLAAARNLAKGQGVSDEPTARRLLAMLERRQTSQQIRVIFNARPQSLVDAIQILMSRPEAIRAILTREAYTDPDTIGGPLDKDLPG